MWGTCSRGGHALEMALLSVGLGAVLFAPNRRFMLMWGVSITRAVSEFHLYAVSWR